MTSSSAWSEPERDEGRDRITVDGTRSISSESIKKVRTLKLFDVTTLFHSYKT